jgi:hypothetical protein
MFIHFLPHVFFVNITSTDNRQNVIQNKILNLPYFIWEPEMSRVVILEGIDCILI